jgi:hypothetical protein
MKYNLIYVKNFNIFLEPETCDVYTSAGYLSNYWLRTAFFVETNFGKFMGLVDYFFRILNLRNFLNNVNTKKN